MKIIFMGTPDFAVSTLTLLAKEHEVIAVYTRAPKPKGRGMAEQITPVHALANSLNIPVFTPKSLKSDEEQAVFSALKADVCVVVAYGLLLPKAVLDAPTHGCYNLHGSLLPRWRGAAPLQRAIMAGDSETGVMVMKMDVGLDTGDIALTHKYAIQPTNTCQDVHDALAIAGAKLMRDAMNLLARDALPLTPQPYEGVVYAAKIDKAEAALDFTQDAKRVDCTIRGLSPFPGGWFMMNGARMKVLRSRYIDKQGEAGTLLDTTPTIACGQGAVELLEVQKAGGKPMSGEEFMRGISLEVGQSVN